MKTTFLNSTKTSYKIDYDGKVVIYYSYQTPIAIYYPETNKGFRTAKKYSVTTSKQISTYVHRDLLGDSSVLETIPHDEFLNKLSDLGKPEFTEETNEFKSYKVD